MESPVGGKPPYGVGQEPEVLFERGDHHLRQGFEVRVKPFQPRLVELVEFRAFQRQCMTKRFLGTEVGLFVGVFRR